MLKTQRLSLNQVIRHSEDAAERIAHLEQLVGQLTVALDIQKKAFDMVELTPSEKRNLIETLRDDYSVRQISETLGFNRELSLLSTENDPCEEVLREEIERLSARYSTYVDVCLTAEREYDKY